MGMDNGQIPSQHRVLFQRSQKLRPISVSDLRPNPANTSEPPYDGLLADHLNNIARLKRLRADAVDRILRIHRKPKVGNHIRPTPVTPKREALRDILDQRPAQFWLQHCALPFDRMGRTALVLVTDAKCVTALQEELSDIFDEILPVIAERDVIEKQLLAHFSETLTTAANQSVPAAQSCRSYNIARARLYAGITGFFLTAALIFTPVLVLTCLSVLAFMSLVFFTLLRSAGMYWMLHRKSIPPKPNLPSERPFISMIVPLYREAEIGKQLLRRLCRLSYPRDRLEILLVLEADDDVTRNAVRCADLPPWFRVVHVPPKDGLKTKPRAMNYALNLCRGEIIGVWDAEDAPAPHQLDIVAQKFANAPENTVCFQGILDFYNPDHNWISRCFSLEYAGWFRVVLQGLAHLKLVVPLGGTTMFIRRDVLNQLGAWDAHNVTEDADLGIRIARKGWQTQMLPITTYEEANSRVIPWIKQRSRWLKGFIMTYLVHMRRPKVLLQDLGLWRFVGFQAFFLGTIGHFLLAPILWSFWLVALGITHPTQTMLPASALNIATVTLIVFELMNITIWWFGARASGRPWLALWSITMPIYFIMGCAAAYKALYEIFAAPFFWDKTAHGVHHRPRHRHRWFHGQASPQTRQRFALNAWCKRPKYDP